MLKIKRALISVSDKSGVVELARCLASFKVEIISTGGTAQALRDAGVAVTDISAYTGFPEMLDGRVKTLHPKIHGGLLGLRDNPDHRAQMEAHGIGPIDMVVVNLYPFEQTVRKPGVTLEEAIENIDIGGPSMLRSAAKNYRSVAVVCSTAFYPAVREELEKNKGGLGEKILREMAVEVFRRTSDYDKEISLFLECRLKSAGPEADRWPSSRTIELKKVCGLRYGENPHQQAALYEEVGAQGASLARCRQHQGKELSFNNFLDLEAALGIVESFEKPAACVVKHNNPTGVAEDKDPVAAFRRAWETDPLSAFGGIVGLNRKVDAAAARAMVKSGFLECILAPGYDREALEVFKEKKNLRVIESGLGASQEGPGFDYKKIRGAFLVQDEDARDFAAKDLKTVTRKKPTARQLQALFFAWKVVAHVRSNAIVLAQGTKTVGIGMGQTSRVDSVFMAIKRAGKRARGSVLASDAFFPKADNIALARKAGVRAIIQPGGSIADEEVIRAADRAGIAMVFTGFRHFKH